MHPKQVKIKKNLTFWPTELLPVKETKFTRLSLTIDTPMSTSPVHNDKTAPGILFFSNTDANIFVVATEVREVVGAPFQITVLPHTYSLEYSKIVLFKFKFKKQIYVT